MYVNLLAYYVCNSDSSLFLFLFITKMWKEIGQAFHQIGTTGDGCRCVLLIGKGKGFCGGIDVTDEKFLFGINGDDDSTEDVARKSIAFSPQILAMQAAFTKIESCPVPVVAAIHGACVGAGVDMSCCADVRVCSADAKFSIREVRLGLAADVGTLQRFPKIVGFGSFVRELCLTGGKFTCCNHYQDQVQDQDQANHLLKLLSDLNMQLTSPFHMSR